MIALGLHLYHGAWSSVRTLGYAKPSAHPLHRRIALARRRRSCGSDSRSFPSASSPASSDRCIELKSKTSRRARSSEKWDKHRFDMKLVNPANKRKYTVIVVGSGLAGGAAAASLSELGYNVKCFCFQDSPRRAHSIAAQGGINAAKNYQNDGDSV